ncbi:ferredoxin [Candidatus Woesearchaeota archaeon]|nr:ferredoxin [Candidatus Woesearchaeota archaeon]
MAKFKIVQAQSECIGCGACVGACPENWKMVEVNGEQKAAPIKIEVDELGCNQDATDSCRVECIKIKKL